MWLLPEDLKAQAKTVVEAGADAISASNILRGIAGINIDTGLPWARDIDNEGILRGTAGPISGPAIRPLALRSVAEIASVVDVPISGVGGITHWRHAVEFMMAGCTTVQVGMASMLFGYDMARDLINGLTGFMEQKGYQQVTDFIGLTRRKVTGFGDLRVPTARDLGRRMVVNDKLCDGCGNCVRCCIATADGAARMRKGVAYIDEEKCIQCKTCMLVCPQHAISAIAV
jgi:dihydropyrimidine dehydrogenase (NAD+) subunit PreA